MNDLEDLADGVHDRSTLVAFIGQMADNFLDDQDEWENVTVHSFLEALSAWLGSADQLYRNLNKSFPEQPSWNMIAEMLMAARIYE